MNNLGIIVEYNPFHNGHLYHIEESKIKTNSNNVFAVMSGNFVQRGELSILNKYSRTKTALLNGVDVVIELPTIFSTSSAELFSYSSVSLLHNTNVVNNICFGAETNNIEDLKNLATFLVDEPDEYKVALKNELSKGISFPKARENALSFFNPLFAELVSTPNNILGIEYLKSLIRLKSNITPYLIVRTSSNYNDINLPKNSNNGIASATSIRSAIINNNFDDIKDFIPCQSYDDLKSSLENNSFPKEDNIFTFLKFKLATMTSYELSNISDVTEGLDSRILNTISNCNSYSHFVETLKTKRFTQTKIQRMLIHILLNIDNDFVNSFNNTPPYIRVLGFKKEKSHLIKELIDKASIPVILNIKNADLNQNELNLLEKEFSYTNIYNQLIEENYSKSYNNIKLSDINFERKQPLVII